MSVAASVIITRVRDVLIDSAGTRWADGELLRWMSDGQRTIVMAVPAASATRATVALAAGTLQSAPATAHTLLMVERNNGASDGSTPGRAVRMVSRQLLDNFNPDWHTATKKAVVQSYCFDPNTPKQFFVSPPNTGTGYVDITYAKVPTELASTADTLGVDDIYQTPLVDYVLYRAYLKDADFAAGQAQATGYLNSFQQALGINEQGKTGENPNLGLTPPDMTNRGSAK